jgi:hypothetical protein
MKKTILLVIILLHVMYVYSQHAATRLIEYLPAPGQHINIETLGTPMAAQKMTESVSASVSLGSFGGYVVLGFDKPCINHPDNPFGIDFTIFGNAFTGHAEPGSVWVMKDENRNGLPDDTWYEIAGSNYFHSTTISNYRLTYYKTNTRSVAWKDNTGSTGILSANNYNLQDYYPLVEYFPDYPLDSVSFSGTLLTTFMNDEKSGEIKLLPPAFGYADTRPRKQGSDLSLPDNPYTREVEGAGGDPIDISWAVDAQGNYIELDTIHFVKIVSASLASIGWLGEVSTDVAWVQSVQPNSSITGKEALLVAWPFQPKILAGDSIRLESNYFLKGRKQDILFSYESSDEGIAAVDSGGKIIAVKQGTAKVKITAGEETEFVDITVVVPDSILFLSSFASVYPGDSIHLMVRVLDDSGGILDIPVHFNSTNPMVGEIYKAGEKNYFHARQPGETLLSASVPGFEARQQVRVKVLSPDDKVRVLFAVKKDEDHMYPLQWIEAGATDINEITEHRQKDYSMIGRPVLAHIVAAGLKNAEYNFVLRDDEASGGELYLYKVENDGIFTYGWGGKTNPVAYAKGWIVSLNGSHYINGLERAEVSSGDTVILYHRSDINKEWTFTRMFPSKFYAGPGEFIDVWLEQTSCWFADGKIACDDLVPVAGAEVNAGRVHYTGTDGKTTISTGTSFPIIITSGNNAVLLSSDLSSRASAIPEPFMKIYPNPSSGEIFISTGSNITSVDRETSRKWTLPVFTVKIYNASGGKCIEMEISHIPARIDLTTLPKGFYHLIISMDDHIESHKFIIQ